MSTESITHRLQIIKDIQSEMKKVKALYEEMLDENDDYTTAKEEAAVQREELKIRKQKVLAKPEFVEYDEQIKELKQDMAENKEILYQELADYYKESGNQEIVDSEGKRKRMKFTVKLVNATD